MAGAAPSDTTPARLAALEAGQAAMIEAMGLMLDTLQQQTNLLRELAEAAKDEPGPSPIMRTLDELTGAVVRMGAGIETLGGKLDALPDAIGAVIDGEERPIEARETISGI
ncbi:MAG TPA: hypothetical protein VMF62_08995 [Acetobacteraceae bacterium]|nr:hypothetical protein [Acetobacteraceae bacterium]